MLCSLHGVRHVGCHGERCRHDAKSPLLPVHARGEIVLHRSQEASVIGSLCLVQYQESVLVALIEEVEVALEEIDVVLPEESCRLEARRAWRSFGDADGEQTASVLLK